ncbi:MAG: hypothetical protein ACP5D7_03725 [Limnospira sp.]
MTEENIPKESAMVEQNQETSLVPQEPATSSDEKSPKFEDIQKETQELMDAIRRLALSEMEAAGEFSQEAYIRSVRNARDTIERFQGVTREQMEKSVQTIESQAEKNWSGVLEEIQEWSHRIVKATQAFFDVLSAPRTKDTE